MFTLVVDDFGIEYVGEKHAQHLITTLKAHYDVAEDWLGNTFLRIDLQWNYSKGTLRLSMKNYVAAVLQRFRHKNISNPTHSPHPHNKPTHGVKPQCAPEPNASISCL